MALPTSHDSSYNLQADPLIVGTMISGLHEAGIDYREIKSFKEFHANLKKAGKALGKKNSKKYNQFVGDGFEVFGEYYINSNMFTNTCRLEKFTPITALGIVDHGVDGVAFNTVTKKWATIQFKFKGNPKDRVDNNDDHISNFYRQSVKDFSLGVDDEDHMVIITSAQDLSENLNDYTHFICWHDLITTTVNMDNFWTSFWDACERRYMDTMSSRQSISEFVLYPHQQIVYRMLQSSPTIHGCIAIPTGGGKTVIFIKDIDHRFSMNPNSINLLSSPRLALIDQTQDILHVSCKNTYREVFVCSRDDFGKKVFFEEDETVSRPMNTTDPVELMEILLDQISNDNPPLMIHSTYASLPTVIAAIQLFENNPDISDDHQEALKLCLDTWHADEAHNLVPDAIHKDEEEKARLTALVMSVPELVKRFPRTLFWTATMKHNKTECDMSNKEIFGDIIYSISAAELIHAAVMVSPKVFPVIIESGMTITNEVDTKDIANELRVISNSSDNRQLTYFKRCLEHDVSLNEERNAPTRMIIFADGAAITLHHRRALTELFPEAYIANVTAETSAKDRRYIFDRFSTEPFAVLLNYDIVSEGMDLPGVSSVCVARGMNAIKIQQSVGRCLRLSQEDRDRLQRGEISVNDLSNWVKPYGRVYLPVEAADMNAKNGYHRAMRLLKKLHDAGFDNIYNDIDSSLLLPHNLTDDTLRDTFPDMYMEGLTTIEKLEQYIRFEETLYTFSDKTDEDLLSVFKSQVPPLVK